jgi:gas vesicle protein
MDTQTHQRPDYSFVLGLMAGTFVGAALAAWLAPRAAAELRDRATDSARRFGKRAAEAAEALAEKGNDLSEAVATVVARGAHEVERVATAVSRRS